MTQSSPRSEPAQSRAQASREKIYQAALSLIQERGFDATTMQNISDKAGVARASVFNHFPNKLQFLAEFFRRFTGDVIAAARQAQVSGFRNRLETLCAAIGPIAHTNTRLVAEVASLAMGHGPLASEESEVDDLIRNLFLDIVEDGQLTGEIRVDIDAGFLADLLLALLTVTTHDWVNRGQKTSLQADLSNRFSVLIDGIGN